MVAISEPIDKAWFHIGVSRPKPNGQTGGTRGYRVVGST